MSTSAPEGVTSGGQPLAWLPASDSTLPVYRPLRNFLCLSLALAAGTAHADAPPCRRHGLQASQLAIVINDAEPNSIEVGEYYRQAHGIPAANVVHVNIPNRPRKLSVDQFAQLKERINAQLKPEIQAVLMVWSAPYAVECNAITSAFTLGYDAGSMCEDLRPWQAQRVFQQRGGPALHAAGHALVDAACPSILWKRPRPWWIAARSAAFPCRPPAPIT